MYFIQLGFDYAQENRTIQIICVDNSVYMEAINSVHHLKELHVFELLLCHYTVHEVLVFMYDHLK